MLKTTVNLPSKPSKSGWSQEYMSQQMDVVRMMSTAGMDAGFEFDKMMREYLKNAED